MSSLEALMKTVPGEVTLEVFAKKAMWPIEKMRKEILSNQPLAAYYVTMLNKAMDAVPPDNPNGNWD